MGFYADRVVPLLIDLSMRNKLLRPYRQRVIGAAEGRVLEIGAVTELLLATDCRSPPEPTVGALVLCVDEDKAAHHR